MSNIMMPPLVAESKLLVELPPVNRSELFVRLLGALQRECHATGIRFQEPKLALNLAPDGDHRWKATLMLPGNGEFSRVVLRTKGGKIRLLKPRKAA